MLTDRRDTVGIQWFIARPGTFNWVQVLSLEGPECEDEWKARNKQMEELQRKKMTLFDSSGIIVIFFPQCLSTSVVLKYWPSSGAKKQTFLFLFLSAEHLNFRCVPDCWRNFSIHFFKPTYKTWKTLQWVIMRNCLWNDWALWLNVTHMYLLERKEKQLYPTRVCGLNLLLQKSQYSNI